MAKCNIVPNNNKYYKVTAKAVNEASCKNHALKEKSQGFEKKVNKLEIGLLDIIINAVKKEISTIIKNNPTTISKVSDFDLILVGKKEGVISDLKLVGYKSSDELISKYDHIFTHLYKGNQSNFKITLFFSNNAPQRYKLNLSSNILELIALINSDIPIKFGAPPSLLGRHTVGILNNIKLEFSDRPKTLLNNSGYGLETWGGVRVYINWFGIDAMIQRFFDSDVPGEPGTLIEGSGVVNKSAAPLATSSNTGSVNWHVGTSGNTYYQSWP